MKTLNIFYLFLLTISISSCIGDDILDDKVDPELRITNIIDSLQVGTEFQFDATYFNNVGLSQQTNIIWTSSDPSIISISPSGLAEANDEGSVLITATASENEEVVVEEFTLVASEGASDTAPKTERSGTIVASSFYVLEGDFTLSQTSDGVRLDIDDNYRASQALPGLYVYLSNNPNSIAGALEIGEVEVFEGRHNYELDGVGLNDFKYIVYFCKPFNVKVGDGEIED